MSDNGPLFSFALRDGASLFKHRGTKGFDIRQEVRNEGKGLSLTAAMSIGKGKIERCSTPY